MTDDEMEAVLKNRAMPARIMGVLDMKTHTEAALAERRLGEAVQFVALAPMDGYDVRASAVLYGKKGTESLRAKDCQQLWAKHGKALVEK
ncbi:hypothetical protein NKH75_07050 [Mesorhizobium sp. M0984]|uniref:hypothetical protein n=1 Tax=unclassified Mesorhizobium TaxID=325217 RepID=UPI00333785AA